mmetsp:Transcript_38140/g.69753  ORF Transcript_38140/g.69753 Transcript_38140/m.69753 type:complete len:106 (+) Transcript_38140:340-657(+)
MNGGSDGGGDDGDDHGDDKPQLSHSSSSFASSSCLAHDTVRRAAVGRKCKRLLDAGRLAFLESIQGFEVCLVHYCSPEVSPENALLLAWRTPDEKSAVKVSAEAP